MLKVFTTFSGYDSQCMALDRVGVEYELVGWSEIDKNAIRAHDAVYPQYADRNYGNICDIDWADVPDFDLLTYSSPCQDFSAAGKQQGGKEGSDTRSSLLWEVRKAIEAKRPKYLLMENVAALVSQKFIGTFNAWQTLLNKLGYTNFAQVLNAKDYGVPQNRKRIFVVSIRDCDRAYYFPKPIPLTKRLKDVLETNVPERYYLGEKAIKRIQRDNTNFKAQSLLTGEENHVRTICANHGKNPHDGNYIINEPKRLSWTRDSQGHTVNRHLNDYCNALTASPRDNTTPYILQQPRGYFEGHKSDIAPTVTTSSFECNAHVVETQRYRIRKLTERECFRLMGVSDTDIDKIQAAGIAKTQQYKMAGNSIVVDVLAAIFRDLFVDTTIQPGTQTMLF